MADNPYIPPNNPTNSEIPAGSQRYFTNARGVNYVPPMRTEWASTGGIPRFPPPLLASLGGVSYDASSTFGGTNKTAMWWYYNSEDNDFYLGLLRGIGMNCIRVFLDYYVWEAKQTEHLDDIRDFLSLCSKHKIRCQFVTWDGIQIGSDQPVGFTDSVGNKYLEPSSTGHADSVPHGLAATWHRVPHAFEYSSTPQAQDFFDNRATPYLDALIASVEPYQSMWSFDVQNELDNETARVFTSATAHHLSVGLSANGVTMTVGNGAGYDPGMFELYQDSGGVSGSRPIWYDPQMSAVLDFASLHTYGNSKFSILKYVNEGISGSIAAGIPAMYNESTNYDTLSYPGTELGYFYGQKDFGGMIFDGFIENSFSREPFLTVQGLFYADGTVKNSRDTSAYSFYASSENWFSPTQLHTVFNVKTDSINEGADGGFFSGVSSTVTTYDGSELYKVWNPKHLEYSETYSGISESDWLKNRHAIYLFRSTGTNPLVGGNNPNGSVTYPPEPGSDMALDLEYNLAASGKSSGDLVEFLFTLSSMPTLVSYGTGEDGVDYLGRNNQLMFMNHVMKMLTFSTFDTTQNEATRPILTATQWDYNIACTPTSRQTLSAIWGDLNSITDANTIAPFIDNRQLGEPNFDISDLMCHTTGNCFYTGGGGVRGANYPGAVAENADIDWGEYDTYYDSLIASLGDCVQQHINYAATTDPDYGLS